MPRRLFILAASLFLIAASVRAESPGQRELDRGRQSLARRDYGTAAEHLAKATAALDPRKEREALAEAWLQLGVADLTGLDRPEEALAAFRKSAELSGNPSAWLWASTTAEKLGRTEEAREYKARAIGSPQPSVTVEAAPPPQAPENIPGPTPAEPAPVAQAAPPPVAEPAAEKKPDAFQHFFGPKEPAALPPAAAPVEPVKKGGAFQHLFGEKKPAKKLEAKPAPLETPKVDAFQHFFGEKKKDGQPGDENKGEKKEGDAKTPEEGSAPPPR
jgi:tetratricopeptide (TPR) repeat protein